MAKGDGKASKTNVSARKGAKGQKALCKLCGKPVDPVMVLDATGKSRMVKRCCEA